MSELGPGRANNGGARTGGPVPVSAGSSAGIKTPRDIMRDRNAREARRQEEQRAEEQRRIAEERRRSAERRAPAAAGGASRYSQDTAQYATDPVTRQGAFDGAGGDRRSRVSAGGVAGTEALGEPIGRTTQEYSGSRTRAPVVSQQEQPRPAQPSSRVAPRTQQSQGGTRQPASQPPNPGISTQPQSTANTTSSFPHAFERWETLSSHWEGLTSYWLHKLEQNTEEIRNVVPNASTLNRQITDLSAAGANLFHAVVELQRLRASSERKFQRWFFETRADTERNSEMQGQMERQLRLERSAREEAAQKRADAEEARAVAQREAGEMRRELMISKEEARRAWEELGRRNQESLETAQSLKDGRITVVAGVQVVPYFGGPSRTGSASQRPGTREGQQQYYGSTAPSAAAAGLESPGEEQTYYREESSPTNTDPFTEQGRQQQPPAQYEPAKPSLAAGTYQPSTAPQTIIPLASQRSQPVSTSSSRTAAGPPPPISPEGERFYQHSQADTTLHSGAGAYSSEGALRVARPSGAPNPVPREEVRSEGSYVDTLSEGDTEYAIDGLGQIRHDEQGRPIVFRRRAGGALSSPEEVSPESGGYDEEAMRQEREMAKRYGASQQQRQQQVNVPSTDGGSAATAVLPPTADYEGQGYGGWEALQTRHHHPTRLSDVLEEEEERSSRRTGE